MPRPIQVLSLALVALALACGGGGRAPRGCSSNSECPSDAHCSANACVATAPPTATLTAHADQEYWTYYVLSFDAAASLDPAAREGVGEYRWAVEGELAGECPPEIQGAPGATLRVVLTCPGEWKVKLVVVDARGFAGTPVELPVTVREPPAGVSPSDPTLPPRFPPRVEVGPPVETNHRCAADAAKASGWHCTTEGEDPQAGVALSAAGSDAEGGPVSYAWACEAPASIPGAVPFLSAPTSATPRLAIDTDGPSIAGEYRCVVTVTDARHQRKSAIQLVRVGNRAPVVTPATPSPLLAPHLHQPGTGYTAACALPAFTLSDPDGDPTDAGAFVTLDANEGSTMTIGPAALGILVSRERAASLLGPGVSRGLSLTATDSNGGSSTFTWTVLVENAPPIWTRSAGSLSPAHAFVDGAYVASGLLGDFADPEGDPVTVALEDPYCVGSIEGASVRADCAHPYAGVAALQSFLLGRTLQVFVKDPWASSAADLVGVAIGNRPPTVASTAWVAPVELHRLDVCCRREVDPETHASSCAQRTDVYPANTIVVSSIATADPDGDPVQVTVVPRGTLDDRPQRTVCAGGACSPSIVLSLPSRTGCGVDAPSGAGELVLDDGGGPRPPVVFTWQSR